MNPFDTACDSLTSELDEIGFLWSEARSAWNDRVAEEFEDYVISPFQATVCELRGVIAANILQP